MMMKFSLRREKDGGFKHIALGLIPAASIAPKPAVPRTPPPRSPDPSPERPRSALAAAILSSSLTGQTWALPAVRPRSLSDSERSQSCTEEPTISPFHGRDRWSDECLANEPCPSTPDLTKEQLDFERKEGRWTEDEDEDEDEDKDKDEGHANQILETQERVPMAEPVTELPGRRKLSPMAGRRVPSPAMPSRTSHQPSQATEEQQLPHPSLEDSSKHSKVQRPAACGSKEKKDSRMGDEQRLQHLEQEMCNSQASFNLKSSTGSQTDLQSLRQQAQELVDENDALKMTVHRLNVELSRYQSCFRPLSKQELDMKHLSPLLLAYEDRMTEQDTLLQTTEKEVKRLRVHVEEVIKENERLLDQTTKLGAFSQKDCQELQQQALLVLQENQVLMDQLEAQHTKAIASHSRHQSEVTKLSKQVMLLEAEKQSLQEDLQRSRKEAQQHLQDLQALQDRLKDTVTWDEHCLITWKLKRQLEQQESSYKSEVQELLLKVSQLQEENRSLTQERAGLTTTVKSMEVDLELSRHTSSTAERRMGQLKQQKEVCALKEEKTRHYLSSVLSVAEHISQERDHLLHTTLALQQDKRRFIGRILSGTVRLGKLHEEVKVYRRQAWTQLAALEEAAVGRMWSQQKEVLHLQRLLRDRQEAQEMLLQSKREMEEELEVVWQAATRDNQQMKDTVLDIRLLGDLGGWTFGGHGSPVELPEESSTWTPSQKKH